MKSTAKIGKKVGKTVESKFREELNSQLGSYCAAATAACGFFAAQQVRGVIVSILSGVTAGPGFPTVEVDFDGASGAEFLLGVYRGVYFSRPDTLAIMPGPDGGVRGVMEDPSIISGQQVNADPAALPSNYQVGPTFLPAPFRIDFEINTGFDTLAKTAPGNGNFGYYTGVERFLGVTFQLADDRGFNRHFGWIGLVANANGKTARVTGWAYEDVPGKEISTGAGAAVIPEPKTSLLYLLALGAAGIHAYRHRRRKKNFDKPASELA